MSRREALAWAAVLLPLAWFTLDADRLNGATIWLILVTVALVFRTAHLDEERKP